MIASLLDRFVRSQGWLDPLGGFFRKIVGGIYGPLGRPGQALKSFAHGTWLGHALHPVLTDVPLGAWTVAFLADVVYLAGHLSRSIGDFCVFVGVLAAYGALVTGYTDYHDADGPEARTGALHGLIMTITIALYTVSWLLRWLDPGTAYGLAIAVSWVGYALLLSGAYVGGDLTFGQGTMVNRNAFIEGPESEPVRVGTPFDFPEGEMRLVHAGGMPVLVVRLQGRLYAISNTCGHAGGPLNEGTLADGCVTCPWHASKFDVKTGHVKQGPATLNQPALLVTESADGVLVQLTHHPIPAMASAAPPQPTGSPSGSPS